MEINIASLQTREDWLKFFAKLGLEVQKSLSSSVFEQKNEVEGASVAFGAWKMKYNANVSNAYRAGARGRGVSPRDLTRRDVASTEAA